MGRPAIRGSSRDSVFSSLLFCCTSAGALASSRQLSISEMPSMPYVFESCYFSRAVFDQWLASVRGPRLDYPEEEIDPCSSLNWGSPGHYINPLAASGLRDALYLAAYPIPSCSFDTSSTERCNLQSGPCRANPCICPWPMLSCLALFSEPSPLSYTRLPSGVCWARTKFVSRTPA